MFSSIVQGSGISVSVESSPRSPPCSGSGGGGLGAPLKKRIQNAEIDEGMIEEESISPRVLFPSSSHSTREGVARRLDFYSSGDWSPIPLATTEASVASVASVASAASWENALPIVVTRKPEEESVGDCSICYSSLPTRSNHVFTKCGHLFCVKCILVWWDVSSTCAMCRAELLELTDGGSAAPAVPAVPAVPASDSDSDSGSDSGSDADADADEEEGDYAPNFQYFLAAAIADRRHSDDDNIGGRDVEPLRPIPAIDQYLHTDSGVEWSSIIDGTTNPAGDDWGVVLTRHETVNIRWGRETAAMLWARRRFSETLFSDIDFLGETFHTFIPKTNWLWFGLGDMGPQRMFEFVMCRTNVHNRGHETNFFGYLSRIVVVQAEHPVSAYHYDSSFTEWENTNEYAFVVHVFSPTTAPYDVYNLDDETYETTELLFRFADIRRMYSIQTCERGSM